MVSRLPKGKPISGEEEKPMGQWKEGTSRARANLLPVGAYYGDGDLDQRSTEVKGRGMPRV